MNDNIDNNENSKDFQHFYRTELKVYIADLEKERKYTLYNVGAIVLLSLILCAFLLIFLGENSTFFVILILIICCIITNATANRYKYLAKKQILPKLLSFIGNFQVVDYIDDRYIRNLNIFPAYGSVKYDDRIEGKYKLTDIDITELKLYGPTSKKPLIFEGLLITVSSNKRFKGITVIKNKETNIGVNLPLGSRKIIKELQNVSIDLFNISTVTGNKLKLDKVQLEDVIFNEKYYIYSTDQVEARYLLTTSFMERLCNQKTQTSVSFENGKINIALFTPYKNWFEFPLLKRADDMNNYKAIISEIIQIIKLLESLKLEKKIGLQDKCLIILMSLYIS